MNPNLPPHHTYPSEAARYLSLTEQYLGGNVVDIASGGWPVVPHAIQVELSDAEFAKYTGNRIPAVPIQWRGSACDLPFKDNTVDAVHASHILEDFPLNEWGGIIQEWTRVVKHGGHVIILVPERTLWHAALKRGQTPNCSHRYEPFVGDITKIIDTTGGIPLTPIKEELTKLFPNDYSILFVGEKYTFA